MTIWKPEGSYSGTKIDGPIAQQPAWTFACVRKSGFAPSISLEVTSLAIV